MKADERIVLSFMWVAADAMQVRTITLTWSDSCRQLVSKAHNCGNHRSVCGFYSWRQGLSADLRVTFTATSPITSRATALIGTCSSEQRVPLTDEGRSDAKSSDSQKPEILWMNLMDVTCATRRSELLKCRTYRIEWESVEPFCINSFHVECCDFPRSTLAFFSNYFSVCETATIVLARKCK